MDGATIDRASSWKGALTLADDGLITAYLLDGRGGGRVLDWKEVAAWSPDDGLVWVHLDYTHSNAQRWLREESGIGELVAESLLAEETRPHSLAMCDGLLVVLRGVNLNPGSDPEDMVSLRLWLESGRIITTRRRRLLSVDDLRAAIESGQGPTNLGDFLADVADRMMRRMAGVIEQVDDVVDDLEDQVVTAESHQLRPALALVRRQIICLRRYLAPQRETLARLQLERVEWLGELDRLRLREVADRTTRYIEDLDAARDRAAVTQEELGSRLSEQMDRRMYLLSIVAAVFLPLGFITGLLGINVGGIPGASAERGFAVVVVILIGLVALQLWLFRRRHWM